MALSASDHHSYRLGSQYNYTPAGDADIRGETVYTDQVPAPQVLTPYAYRIIIDLSSAVGDFDFGEVGLYDDQSRLLALFVSPTLQRKRNDFSALPNRITVEIIFTHYNGQARAHCYWNETFDGTATTAYDRALADGYVGTLDEWLLYIAADPAYYDFGPPILTNPAGPPDSMDYPTSGFGYTIPPIDPAVFSFYRIGSEYNYTPTDEDRDIRGTALYEGTIPTPKDIGNHSYHITIQLDSTIGDFDLGEIGLYSPTGDMISLSVSTLQLTKLRRNLDQHENGNTIQIDIYYLYGVNRYTAHAHWRTMPGNAGLDGGVLSVELYPSPGLEPVGPPVVDSGGLTYVLSDTLLAWHNNPAAAIVDALGYRPLAPGDNISALHNDAGYVAAPTAEPGDILQRGSQDQWRTTRSPNSLRIDGGNF